jgi:hypothetical protein
VEKGRGNHTRRFDVPLELEKLTFDAHPTELLPEQTRPAPAQTSKKATPCRGMESSRMKTGVCQARKSAHFGPRALGSLPLLHRCDLYRLTLVRRQDAAEGHAN